LPRFAIVFSIREAAMERYYFKIQDQDGVLQPDRGFEFADMEKAKDEARTLLAEMAIDGLPNEPVDSISVELQDANRVPIVTFRLVLEAIPHGAQEV
jgi:hypothetical protein